MKFKDYVKRGLGIAIGATFGFIVTGAAMETAATILLRKMQPKEDNESTDEDIREEE